MSLCANGLCSSNCKSSQDYYKQIGSNTQVALQRTTCGSKGLVQCPNGECRANYFDCSDTLYCPVPINYTYSPQAIICPGAQICALNRIDCAYTKCESGLSNLFLPSQNSYDKLTKTQTSLETCYDGRCHIEGRQIQSFCMTPISCSNQFFKSGGFGEFCVSKNSLAEKMIELSIILGDYNCPTNKVKCVTGECRASFDDCPTQITCPADYPIQCRDGQCAKTKTSCKKVDEAIERNLYKCQSLGMLLCTSDLITCSYSLSQCPSRSSCPIGYIKCWDESCVNPESNQPCPSQSDTSIALISTLSTCQDQEAYAFHCFADGSCRKSLNDCPSISYCPLERPVKCAADNSCRKSIKNCPKTIKCPNGYKFCPSEGNCIKNTLQCGTLSTCSQNQPYKCEDGTCVSDISQCFTSLSTQISQLALACLEDEQRYLCSNDLSKCVSSLIDCPSSTSCSSAFPVKSYGVNLCHDTRDAFSGDFQPQLLMPKKVTAPSCSADGLFTCWDGVTCATDPAKYCRTNNTMCPPYMPVRCNYTGNCVSKAADCLTEKVAQASLSEQCMTQYGMKAACPDGSCASSEDQCRNEYSRNYMQCPQQQPYKCANGLCVKSKQDCPLSMFSIQEIQYCDVVSQQSALNLQIPCGNGQCMESSDQCLPLYDCSLNLLSGEVITCPDGTCRDNLHKCPQLINQICPSHIPFMCQNGQCAKSDKECLLNENGCPQYVPYKCDMTGQCTQNKADCVNPITQVSQMFIYPNYIPPVSATPFIAIYGKTRSICQSRGQFTCRLGNGIPYCVDRLNDCVLTDNNCPVNQPIRCGSTCVTSYLDCQGVLKDNCTSLFTSRCPSQGQTGTQCAQGLNDFSNCLNMDGCSFQDKTFLCAPQIGTKPSCNSLPYSNYQELSMNTCKTNDNQLVMNHLAENVCTDQNYPYSCADGSCVALLNQCPTCIHYCPNLNRCVRTSDDCQKIASQTTTAQQLQLQCPLSTPVRCILDGKCVTDERLCQTDSHSHINTNFIGALVNQQCPFDQPIKCNDGRCVDQYDQCITYQRTKINATNSNALKSPIMWGNQPEFKTNSNPSCQVLCYDGSCKERVENCPIIHGCYDPDRPQRCRSGFCARDKINCIQLFGDIEQDDQNLQSDSCSSVDSFNVYHRCEDGICRQVTDTQTTTSYCQPFMGCPVTTPYHCPTGECAKSIEECAGSSQCPLEKPIRCKNFKCVSSPSQCERAYSTYSSIQIDRTFDPYEDTTINFAFDYDGLPIAKLKIPSSAIKVYDTDRFQTQVQTLQRLQFYPVPDSILELVKNKIADSRISYISRIYSLTEDKYLSRAQTLLSPVVKIDFSSNPVSPFLNKQGVRYLNAIQQESYTTQKPLYIYFKLDNGTFPSVINIREDICLGRVDHINSLIQSQKEKTVKNIATWYCEKRNFSMTEDGFLKYKINSFGIYALIINPNPDVKVQTAQECGFYCQNHLIILILLMALTVILILLIYCFCECCKQHTKTQSRLIAELKRTQQQQSQNQSDSFFGLNQSRLKQLMPAYITQEAFMQDDNSLEAELNMEKVRDVLDNLSDPADPPLMPGQVVMYLAHQSESQAKQIEQLKYQLEEQNEREKENLKLIKRIFHQKQLIYEQMQVESEIRSQSRKSRSSKAKKRKQAIDDPTIKKEYEDIEAYLSKILSETHLPDPFDPSASQATFQQFPGRAGTLKIPQSQQLLAEQQSFHSIPVNQVQQQSINKARGSPEQADSIKNMITTQKQSQSTTILEINQGKLQRKAADMLMRNLDAIESNKEVEQFEYEERADEFLRLKKAKQPISDDGADYDGKNGSQMSFDQDVNVKYSQHRDTSAAPLDPDQLHSNTPTRYRDQYLNEGLSGTGLMDSQSLNQTLSQLFSKARKSNGNAKTYSMLMSGGAVSGTVSGNLVKALVNKFEVQKNKHHESYSNQQKQTSPALGYQGIDEDESEEDDDFNQGLHYEDYPESNSTPKKR